MGPGDCLSNAIALDRDYCENMIREIDVPHNETMYLVILPHRWFESSCSSPMRQCDAPGYGPRDSDKRYRESTITITTPPGSIIRKTMFWFAMTISIWQTKQFVGIWLDDRIPNAKWLFESSHETSMVRKSSSLERRIAGLLVTVHACGQHRETTGGTTRHFLQLLPASTTSDRSQQYWLRSLVLISYQEDVKAETPFL